MNKTVVAATLFLTIGFLVWLFMPQTALSADPIEKAKLESLFDAIYKKNRKSELMASQLQDEPRIPLKIHQIWIGPRPVPEKFKWMMKTWQDQHPHWEYKLWTNDDLKTFPFINKEAFDAAKNWGMKADILRYEILYNHGGVYVDLDFECFKPFDALNYAYDFYAGLTWPHEINNALIAAAPGSIIMREAINAIAKNVEQVRSCSTQNVGIGGVLSITGPLFFTKIFVDAYARLNEEMKQQVMVLPVPYFYAFPTRERDAFWAGRLPRERVMAYVLPETYSIHYWAMSYA